MTDISTNYECLRNALQSGSGADWFTALKSVDNFHDGAIIAILREALRSPDFDVRLFAANYVGETDDPSLALDLIDSAETFNDNAAIPALEALGILKNKEDRVVKFLVGNLGHPSRNMRTNAAKAIGQLEIHTAVGDLIHVASDRSAGVRLAAIHALAQIGSPDAVSALSHIAADGYRWLSTLAAFDELLAVADTPSRREGLQYVAENGGRRMRRRAVGALLKTPRTVDR